MNISGDPAILRLSNLTKIYRRSHLGRVETTIGIEKVSLEIYPGEIFALLGLNGAGKTTTFKLILGLLFPTSGESFLMGKKLPNQDVVQRVGYLPEIPYFPKYLTVEEILRFYGLLSGIPQTEISEQIEEVLGLVKMSAYRRKRIKECSKGMLQRVSMAQALIHHPEFLILDEPITGLDPLGLAEMRDMILQLNSVGKTVLFSSHMIAEVEKIAHRGGILVNGQLKQVLNSKEWAGKPGNLEKIFVETVKKFEEPIVV